jgi:hypothetical protein
MSINDIVICDPSDVRAEIPWVAIGERLERAGFGLYFDAVSNDFTRADNWVKVMPGTPPKSGAFLADSPTSGQARVLLN